jgi:hypothetical protein
LLERVAQSDRLPPHMQRDVALAVRTRAVLLEDAEIGNSVAPIVARHFPQYGGSWRAYQSAATPQQQVGCLRRLGMRLSVSCCPHHEVERLGHPRIARLRIALIHRWAMKTKGVFSTSRDCGDGRAGDDADQRFG